MKDEQVFNVKSRPPRLLNFEEVGRPVNPLKYINLMKPILTTFAPLVPPALTAFLKKELIFGKPIRIKDIMVTMRDGAKTALDVYFPRKVYKKKLKCPTILIRTPYWKGELGQLLGSLYTQNGFILVIKIILSACYK